jgi:hypothetical protein
VVDPKHQVLRINHADAMAVVCRLFTPDGKRNDSGDTRGVVRRWLQRR